MDHLPHGHLPALAGFGDLQAGHAPVKSTRDHSSPRSSPFRRPVSRATVTMPRRELFRDARQASRSRCSASGSRYFTRPWGSFSNLILGTTARTSHSSWASRSRCRSSPNGRLIDAMGERPALLGLLHGQPLALVRADAAGGDVREWRLRAELSLEMPEEAPVLLLHGFLPRLHLEIAPARLTEGDPRRWLRGRLA